MQQTPAEFPRLDLELLAGLPIDYLDANPGLANAIAKLRGEIPLNLLAAQLPSPGQQRLHFELRPGVRKEHPPPAHRVARIAFPHPHLVGLAIKTGRAHRELLTHCPEAEQADTKLSLNPRHPIRFEPALQRVTDMCRHIPKVRNPLIVTRNPLTVITHGEVVLTPLAPPGDRDVPRARIDAVLDKLRHRFQGIALGERNDRNGVPVVPNPKPPRSAGRTLLCLFPDHLVFRQAYAGSPDSCLELAWRLQTKQANLK